MTPNDIEILIHCYVTTTPHPRRDAPAVLEAFKMMAKNGLLVYEGDRYVTTDRGRAHIAQLCQTPWPTQAWINQDGRIIETPP